MSTEPTDLTVFYSWQSDSPSETNRNAIRAALRVASSKLEESSKWRILYDEATRGSAGSPNIPATILEKIKACDVFVCDITTINSAATDAPRKTPNPNVLFELGYAVSQLGWSRVVMVINEAFGTPKDAPFDIDRHRIGCYLLTPENPKDKASHAQLTGLLSSALFAIAQQNPARPIGDPSPSREQIRRVRDTANLKWVLGALHLPTLDEMANQLPHSMRTHALHFWAGFNSVMNDSRFHLYDEEALKHLRAIHEAWGVCVSHGMQYQPASNSMHVFRNPGVTPLTLEQEAAWAEIETARDMLSAAQRALVKQIREEYLEIDLNDTSASAWREYVEFERGMEQRFARSDS